MISVDSPPTLREARLNALANLAEWQKLLTHFSLEPDEFAFIPIFVPDSDWAEVCRESLAAYLQTKEKKQLKLILTETPDELKNLAGSILNLKPEAEFGAVWIVAPVTLKDDEKEIWQAAWREGMARLNQYRNPFRQKFNIPVLLVGADQTKELIRDSAPDLWSVRTTVVNIEPPVISLGNEQTNTYLVEPSEDLYVIGSRRSDPEFALREAARLRGQVGKELSLAQLLDRAAFGFIEQRKYQSALKASEEADNLISELLNQSETKPQSGEGKIELKQIQASIKIRKGVSLYSLGKLNEAIIEYEKAIAIQTDLVESGRSELANDLAKAYLNKGVSLDSLGKLNEAIIEYEKAIAIRKDLVESGRTELANDLAKAYLNKGNALYSLGKLNEAIVEYDKAIEILTELIESSRPELANSLASAFMNKGVSLDNLGKLNEAIVEYDKAIEILRRLVDGNRPELANDLASAYLNKGNAFDNLGKLKEALFQSEKAIEIYEKLVNDEGRNEFAEDLASCYMNEGITLMNIGKLNQAVISYDKALGLFKILQHEKSQIPIDFAGAYLNKGIAIKKLGRLNEAEDLLKQSDRIYQKLIGQENNSRKKLKADLDLLKYHQQDIRNLLEAKKMAKVTFWASILGMVLAPFLIGVFFFILWLFLLLINFLFGYKSVLDR